MAGLLKNPPPSNPVPPVPGADAADVDEALFSPSLGTVEPKSPVFRVGADEPVDVGVESRLASERIIQKTYRDSVLGC